MSRPHADQVIIALARACPKCGGSGPFYRSQSQASSWCIACMKAAAAQRYVHYGASINAAAHAQRVQRIFAIAPEQRTRRQAMFVMRATSDSAHARLCAWCWQKKPTTHFRVIAGAASERLDGYCRACRRILDRLRDERNQREARLAYERDAAV